MTYLFGLKDTTAQAFVQVVPAKSVELVKRDLKNAVNTPSKSIVYTNPEDLQLFRLGTYDEETGAITSDIKLEFNLAELKINAS